jgi:hypothetical protein
VAVVDRWRSTSRLIALVVAAAVCAGCVRHPIGAARDEATYRDKAVVTAESALSAVATVALAAQAAAHGQAWGRFVGRVVSEQEDALDKAAGSFRSIQPPDEASDRLRTELLGLLDAATDHVTTVRISARRDRLGDLDQVAGPLTADHAALQHFTETNGGGG